MRKRLQKLNYLIFVPVIVIACVLQLRAKCVYDVKTIVQSITQGARNELEKLRAIWVWLCHNIGEIEKSAMYHFLINNGLKLIMFWLTLCEQSMM